MKYDFDKVIDRTGTDSVKWSKKFLGQNFNNENALPLWVADMEFEAPKPVVDALVQRAAHGIFGYGEKQDDFYDAIIGWQARRNDWHIEKDWILYSPGIVTALNFIVELYCRRGDNVIIQSPVYYPFYNVVESNGCNVALNPLVNKDGRYEMNFDELEKLAADEKTTMMILCSPHNPVGRVWKDDELRRVAQICKKHGVLVVADEIHSDLIYKPHKHTVFAKIAEEEGIKCIVCNAPSKTFNLAGVQISNIIIPDYEMRKKLYKRFMQIGFEPSSFATVAQTAAYNEGEEWLEQLMEYLEGNADFIAEYLEENLPKIKYVKPEGTYLAWLDFSEYGFSVEELRKLMRLEAGLALDDGIIFGEEGAAFQRINFACPRVQLEEAMDRLKSAVEKIV